jgi:hypothetical protein
MTPQPQRLLLFVAREIAVAQRAATIAQNAIERLGLSWYVQASGDPVARDVFLAARAVVSVNPATTALAGCDMHMLGRMVWLSAVSPNNLEGEIETLLARLPA